MANLIEYIQSQVYENSTEDISGSIMQQVLTRMASDEGVVNVHTISGQTPFADYNNAQAARGAVPDGFKKLGLIITYKLSSGWYIDEFIGSATSGWSTSSNWKCLGPISVSQNASTGKTTITIGSQSYDVATQPVSVSQNTPTGTKHIRISVGGNNYDIASAEEVEDMVKPTLDANFEISDENSNSIVQFKEGHIKTKNFDSKNIKTSVSDAENADFEIADTNDKVLARLANGEFRTKKFDSSFISDIISRYKYKRFSLLGDSISTFGSPSATNENGTYCYSYYPNASCRYSQDGVDSIQFDVENTYWMKLIRKTRMVLGVNDSYRGTKVSGTDNALSSQTRINHLGLKGNPDVILVYGGTNDAGWGVTIGTFNTESPQDYTDEQIANLPVTTFADAYRTMLIRLMKTYPNAEIVVVLPTFTTTYYTIANLDNYVELIKEACDFFGIKYIDARVSGINVFNKLDYLVDGIHPNAAGMDLLFKTIYKHLIFE